MLEVQHFAFQFIFYAVNQNDFTWDVLKKNLKVINCLPRVVESFMENFNALITQITKDILVFDFFGTNET